MSIVIKHELDEVELAHQVVQDCGPAGALDLVHSIDTKVADFGFTMSLLELAIQALLHDLAKEQHHVPDGGAQELARVLQTAREKANKYC